MIGENDVPEEDPDSNITPNDIRQRMGQILDEALAKNNSELLKAIVQEAWEQNLYRMDYLDYLLLKGDSRLPFKVIEYRKSLENEITPLGSASPKRQEFIKKFVANLSNRSGSIKRRVLKRQSTRGKKERRIKPKRQNGSKKRKGVKTRYVQGKKKKKKMNKKFSQKQNKK
tara:strand:+ start:3805 stop:4317 length:513 start_codon:yes stop_codon:yes gene_type:complete